MNLQQSFKRWKSEDDCILFLEKIKWGTSPCCPYCKSIKNTAVPKENRYHCNTCLTSFSVTTKTLFHKTKVDLRKWLVAINVVTNADKITARKLAEELQVTKDTALFISKRIKKEFLEQSSFLHQILKSHEQ
ncbi:MAG: IS1595 family transposase [Sphingobacteriales bacterium]|nr:MAG: IS1595 family transposase [Sphingobacteriales bacterium]